MIELEDRGAVTILKMVRGKGNALNLLAEEMGIKRSEVLAIGDSVNDVSMLEWAGHSAVPAHCDHHARAVAREILPGFGVEGVVAKLQAIADQVD